MRRRVALMALVALTLTARTTSAQPARVDLHGDPLPRGALQRLGTIRYRQAVPITAFAFAPDGKTYATAANTHEDPGVRLWETATGKEILLCAAPDNIGQVAFAPDGKSVAAACGNDLYFWDTKTSKKLRHFQGHPDGVGCIAFSPDGQWLAVGGKRPSKGTHYTIRLLDASTGKLIRTFEKHFTWINVVAFSTDGSRLASASTAFQESKGSRHLAGTLCVWDIATGKRLHQLLESGADIEYSFDHRSNVAVSPDVSSAIFVGPDEQLQAWDLAAGKRKWVIPDKLVSFAFTPDGSHLVAGAEYASVRLYNAASGKLVSEFAGVGGWGRSVAGVDPTGKYVATVTSIAAFGQVRLWDLANGKELTGHDGHQDNITFMQSMADGKRVVTAGFDGTVRFWDAATGKVLQALPGHIGWNRTALTPDGKTLITCGEKGRAQFTDLPAGKPREVAGPTREPLHTLALSPDGKVLAQTDLQTLSLYEVPSGKLLVTIRQEVHEMCFGPDSQLLATAGPTIRLWHVPSGRPLLTFRDSVLAGSNTTDTRDERYWAIAFSPDGQWLASCDTKNRLCLWEVATGQAVMDIPGLGFSASTFTPDSGLLVVNARAKKPNADHAVTFWDMRTGQCVGGIDGHFLSVTAMAHASDGRTFLTASADGNVLVWDAATLPRAKPMAPRKLAGDELAALWEDLVSSDARKAYQAIVTLSAGGKPSTGFLQERLQPVKPLPVKHREQLEQLIVDLNDDRYAMRARAMTTLETHGEAAARALRAALKDGISLEMRLRIELLLGKLERFTPPSEELRQLRAVAVLERLATPEARKVLVLLASGAEARLTRAAAAALKRWPT